MVFFAESLPASLPDVASKQKKEKFDPYSGSMNFILYNSFRFLFKLAVRFFFRIIEIKGLEHVPAKGPMLIVANHPATFLDPIVIAVNLKVRVYFLAKAVIFKSPLAARFFRLFNVIPIYRAQDDPSKMGKNEETFGACHAHLAKGGSIMIFPEGISQSVRQLLKIKTGTARIALGAEAQNDFKLGVQILPVGLNYSNQEKFQSKLFISFDEPINTRSYENAYLLDPVIAVKDLTEEIGRRIEQQVINAGNERLDVLILWIEKLMKARILRDWGVPKSELEQDHKVTKRITEAVQFFAEKDPLRVSRLENEMADYFERLKEADLPESIIESKKLTSKAMTLYFSYFLLGFPFFLFGLINNYLPYRISIAVARASTGLKEYRGAIGFAAGTFIFLIIFFLEFVTVEWFARNLWFTSAYILLVPFTGIFSFYYWKKTVRFYYKAVFAKAKKKFFLKILLAKRERIINELEKARQEFLKDVG